MLRFGDTPDEVIRERFDTMMMEDTATQRNGGRRVAPHARPLPRPVGRWTPLNLPAGNPGGAAYPNRACEIEADVKAEFGVETAHELVALLNAAWAKVGRARLAVGSYPTKKGNLPFILRELRLARAAGTL